MNFSINRKLRKMLSLITALVLLTTLFAGCGKSGTDESTDPNDNLGLESSTPTETQTQPTETEPVQGSENMGTVISKLTVRSAPSTQANEVGTLMAGDRVEVLRRDIVAGVEWGYVILPDGNKNWICMDFVKMDVEPEDPTGGDDTTDPNGDNPSTNVKGVINVDGLQIRSEPNTDSSVNGTYGKGDVVTILEIKDGWGRTNKGWIKLQYVTTSADGNPIGGNDDDDDDTGNNNNNNGNVNGNGSTTVQFRGIVTASQLNIRDEASTNGEKVGSLNYGARVEIYEKSGNWGRIKNGWISLDYVYQDGTTGTKTCGAIVTGDELNIRSGPGTNYASVGSLNEGEHVTILEQFTYNGTTWGCIKNGWICMDYVRVDGTESDDSVTGTVTGDQVNIRSGPGTNYNKVGTLNSGDEVVIFYQTTVNGRVWGNIEQGWICLDYVELD